MHELGIPERFDPFPPNIFEGEAEHRHDANRALLLSELGLTLTGGIELAIALISGSVGLLGDAGVSTSLVAFVGFRVSRRGASASHPYGYERAEDLAGLGVALVIWISAVFAGYVSIHKLISHDSTSHL
jgi:divalent metal cation (Fe/Co/Zn/Cd) transporter